MIVLRLIPIRCLRGRIRISMLKDLLLLLQGEHDIYRDLQHTRHDLWRRQRQPLGQRNVGHAFRLVDLDEGQVLCG